jgi:hypothetical protein
VGATAAPRSLTSVSHQGTKSRSSSASSSKGEGGSTASAIASAAAGSDKAVASKGGSQRAAAAAAAAAGAEAVKAPYGVTPDGKVRLCQCRRQKCEECAGCVNVHCICPGGLPQMGPEAAKARAAASYSKSKDVREGRIAPVPVVKVKQEPTIVKPTSVISPGAANRPVGSRPTSSRGAARAATSRIVAQGSGATMVRSAIQSPTSPRSASTSSSAAAATTAISPKTASTSRRSSSGGGGGESASSSRPASGGSAPRRPQSADSPQQRQAQHRSQRQQGQRPQMQRSQVHQLHRQVQPASRTPPL